MVSLLILYLLFPLLIILLFFTALSLVWVEDNGSKDSSALLALIENLSSLKEVGKLYCLDRSNHQNT